MGGATRGVVIVGWANVIVAAVMGWLALAAMTSVIARSGGWELLRIVVAVVWAVVQLVAGLELVDRRDWARRWLMYGAAVHLALIAEAFASAGMPAVREMIASSRTFEGMALRLLPLAAYAVPVVTLVYLARPAVRASFPQTNRREWLLVDAPVVALALLAVVSWFDGRLLRREAPSSASPLWSKPIEPGVGNATLVPTYDGQPIADFTAADMRFSLTIVKETPYISPVKKVQTSTRVETLGPLERPWRLRRGRITVKRVPAGVYQANIELDRNGDEDRGNAGDLVASAHVELRTGHGPVREQVRLRTIMALREPKTAPYARPDAGKITARVWPTPQEIESLPQVAPHVTFAWDPVPGAVAYDLTVACEGSPTTPLQTKVDRPSWTTDLTQCPVPYPWVVYLSARDRVGIPIGHLPLRAFVVDGTPPSRATRGLEHATLTLRPTFDGRPLRDLDESDVAIELHAPGNESSHPRARVRHGRIKIPRFVPKPYAMTVLIGPDARKRVDCRARPGDFVGSGFEALRNVRTDWQPESRTLAVQRTMQSVEPEDPASCWRPLMHVQSPVHLRWEPVPEAVDYTVRVSRLKERRGPGEKIVVREPSWQAPLERNDPTGYDNYIVRVAARSAKGADIALLEQHLVVE
jgi:hypothetical protein